jgi:redox-sensing transcriptional repressor
MVTAVELKPIPQPTLRRLPMYHHLLKRFRDQGMIQVSCSVIANALGLDPTQVRKDLEFTDIIGRPRVGYELTGLIRALEEFLGLNNVTDAFLVGVGSMGRALLGYQRFRSAGLNIRAAFDNRPEVIGTEVAGRKVLAVDKLPGLTRRMHIHLGIITVPEASAQGVAEMMVKGGILAIWNFSPVSLRVPADIIVQNEDLYSSLAGLSYRLAQKLHPNPDVRTLA